MKNLISGLTVISALVATHSTVVLSLVSTVIGAIMLLPPVAAVAAAVVAAAAAVAVCLEIGHQISNPKAPLHYIVRTCVDWLLRGNRQDQSGGQSGKSTGEDDEPSSTGGKHLLVVKIACALICLAFLSIILKALRGVY